MHNCRNRRRGFTLAEMILAMIIVSLLTVAMVPMLKYHKVRKRESFTPHGIAECYYDANGTLYSFYKDNDKNTSGTKTQGVNGSCTFNIPKANYYELHVIGAGGVGGGSSDSAKDTIIKQTKITHGNEETKEITVDESFQAQVARLNEYVRVLWQRSKVPARQTFKIQAPMGSGGYTAKANTPFVDDDGSVVYKETDTEIKRGNSGNSKTSPTSGYYEIFPSTTIDKASYPDTAMWTWTPILTIGGQVREQMRATMPAYGAAKVDNYICNGTPSVPCGNKIEIQGGTTPTYTDSASTVDFSISSSITFTYKPVTLSYNYGLSGTPGVYATTYYERFKGANKIVMTPAQDINSASIVTTKKDAKTVQTLYTTENKKVITQRNDRKANEETLEAMDITNVSAANLPVPREFIYSAKDLIKPESPDYYAKFCSFEGDNTDGMCNYITSKIKDGMAANKLKPGAGGYGGYPILNKLSAATTVKMKDSVGTQYLTNSTLDADAPQTSKCLYHQDKYDDTGTSETGFTPIETSGGNYFCKGTKGNPGAIILLW